MRRARTMIVLAALAFAPAAAAGAESPEGLPDARDAAPAAAGSPAAGQRVAGAGGAARVADPALGMVLLPEFGQMGEIAPALDIARVRIGWERVQQGCKAIRKGRFRWRSLDRDLRGLTGRGVPLIATVMGGPGCAREHDADGAREPKRRYRDEFARFAARVATRYGPRAARGGRDRCCGIEELEVWNEPNILVKWTDPDGAEYARMLKLVSSKVRRAPGTGGIRILSGGITSKTAVDFLARFYEVANVRRAYDAIGVHTYNPDAATALRRLAQIRGVMRRNGERGPIAITEHGWSTCARPTSGYNGKCTSRSGQAEKLGDYVRGLRSRPGLGVESLLWFMPQDTGLADNERVCPEQPKFFYGLFDRDGEPKPSWAVWREATGAAGPARLDAIPPGRRDDCTKDG